MPKTIEVTCSTGNPADDAAVCIYCLTVVAYARCDWDDNHLPTNREQVALRSVTGIGKGLNPLRFVDLSDDAHFMVVVYHKNYGFNARRISTKQLQDGTANCIQLNLPRS